MFKVCLKNYLHGLRYVFTVIGTIFIGIILGISVMTSTISGSVITMIDEVKVSTENTDFTLSPVSESDSVLVGISEVIGNYLGYAESLFQSAVDMIAGFIDAIIYFLIFLLSGILLGYFLVDIFMLRDVEKKGIFKVILMSVFHTALILLFVGLIVLLVKLLGAYAFLGLILFPFFHSAFMLLSAFILSGYGKVKLSQVMKPGNIFIMALANLLEFVISFVIALLVGFISQSAVLFVVVFISLTVVTVAVLSSNAGAYVVSLKDSLTSLPVQAGGEVSVE